MLAVARFHTVTLFVARLVAAESASAAPTLGTTAPASSFPLGHSHSLLQTTTLAGARLPDVRKIISEVFSANLDP